MLCAYIHTYILVFTCIHIRTCVCIAPSIVRKKEPHTQTHTHTHKHTHTHTHNIQELNTMVYTCINTHVYIHTHISRYLHSLIYDPVPSPLVGRTSSSDFAPKFLKWLVFLIFFCSVSFQQGARGLLGNFPLKLNERIRRRRSRRAMRSPP
jgi:hypothetical protein